MTPERDWSAPNAMAEWQAQCKRTQAEVAATSKTALELACEMIRAGVQEPLEGVIATRTARYRSDPALLLYHLRDAGIAGIGRMTTVEIVTRIDAEIAARLDEPRRYAGFGGENTIISLKAARRCVMAAADERGVA